MTHSFLYSIEGVNALIGRFLFSTGANNKGSDVISRGVNALIGRYLFSTVGLWKALL